MNENPYVNDMPRNGAAMSGFILGAIVGAGVALLFAPASGTDTRRRLGETARKMGSAAREKLQQGRDQVQDVLERGRQGFESGVGSPPEMREPGRTGNRSASGRASAGAP